MSIDQSDGATRLRVLVVDDCHDTADGLALLIQMWGHECRVAYDGAVALEMFAPFRPNVVFADIAMPGVDGFELAAQLRKVAGPGQPLLVAVSGLTGAAHCRAALDAGFDHFLIKPADPVEVQSFLANVSKAVQLSRQNGELTERSLQITELSRELIATIRGQIDAGRQP